ncbi:tyrosine-type recombinase/integrase [Paenibacillus sp. MWE-103]|uniref:Tyrosine-type recombinase/integrase n=1 Tax=Paenibacillus artemisiicola TaxID=1172618 RepID=A0ABS3WL21_9BACL|nr:tyrosine-type recombinase/integrase [Paenibacillus artemisiicola]MBO7748995.1 tyrosine-type recombinase/integrase [Paenibacillus artemisiicola]
MPATNQVKDIQPIRSREKIDDMKWALRRFCSERDYILFLVGVNTGLRVGDIVKLKTKELLGKKRVVVKEGKTGKSRELLLANIYDELNAYLDTVDSEWAFPSRKGGGAITPTQSYRQLNKAADMAEVESMGNHTLRKTFGYWMYKQTRDVAKLQRILNHSHPAITLTYIGITDEEIEQDLETFVL